MHDLLSLWKGFNKKNSDNTIKKININLIVNKIMNNYNLERLN